MFFILTLLGTTGSLTPDDRFSGELPFVFRFCGRGYSWLLFLLFWEQCLPRRTSILDSTDFFGGCLFPFHCQECGRFGSGQPCNVLVLRLNILFRFFFAPLPMLAIRLHVVWRAFFSFSVSSGTGMPELELCHEGWSLGSTLREWMDGGLIAWGKYWALRRNGHRGIAETCLE